MPSVLGCNLDTEVNTAYEEGRSVLGSIVTQLVSIVRAVLNWAIQQVGKIVTWAGEHPLAAIMLGCNIAIWVSP